VRYDHFCIMNFLSEFHVLNKYCIYVGAWNVSFFEPILYKFLRGFRICKAFLHALHRSWDMVIFISQILCQGFMFQIKIAFTCSVRIFYFLNLFYVVFREDSKYITHFCTTLIDSEIWSFFYHRLFVWVSCFKWWFHLHVGLESFVFWAYLD
jgi:hypothetical protein